MEIQKSHTTITFTKEEQVTISRLHEAYLMLDEIEDNDTFVDFLSKIKSMPRKLDNVKDYYKNIEIIIKE